MSHPSFKLRIGNETVSVIPMDNEEMTRLNGAEPDGELMGYSLCMPEYVAIYNEGLGDRQAVGTAWHELMHNISTIYGLDLTEPQVRVLEQSIGQLLSNKKFAAWSIKHFQQ